MKKEIKKISLSSLFSALIVVLLMVGTLLEILDITVAAVCSIIVFIVQIEADGKYPFLVYLTATILSLILSPPSTATLYFAAFFGYYPIIKKPLLKLKKRLRKAICIIIFNIAMVILMLLFKAVFALQGEPAAMYVALLITINIFFLCFDYLLDVFTFIYFKRIRSKLKFIK